MDETVGFDLIFILGAILFIVVMAARAWTHGALGMLWALCTWAAGIAAGIWTYRNGTGLLREHADLDPGVVGSAVTSVVLAIAAFIIARMIAKAILLSMFGPDSILGGWMYGPTGAILSVLPSCAIILLIALLIRNTGTMSELQRVDAVSNASEYWNAAKYPESSRFTQWRDGLEKIPGSEWILDRTDPISTKEKRNLVAFLLATYSPSARKRLQKRPETAAIAENPYVAKELMEDEEIKAIVEGKKGNFKYFRLMKHPKVEEATRRPDLRHRLTPVDMNSEIRSALTEEEKESKKTWLQKIFS